MFEHKKKYKVIIVDVESYTRRYISDKKPVTKFTTNFLRFVSSVRKSNQSESYTKCVSEKTITTNPIDSEVVICLGTTERKIPKNLKTRVDLAINSMSFVGATICRSDTFRTVDLVGTFSAKCYNNDTSSLLVSDNPILPQMLRDTPVPAHIMLNDTSILTTTNWMMKTGSNPMIWNQVLALNGCPEVGVKKSKKKIDVNVSYWGDSFEVTDNAYINRLKKTSVNFITRKDSNMCITSRVPDKKALIKYLTTMVENDEALKPGVWEEIESACG